MDLAHSINSLRELNFTIYDVVGFGLIPLVAVFCNSFSVLGNSCKDFISFVSMF